MPDWKVERSGDMKRKILTIAPTVRRLLDAILCDRICEMQHKAE